MKFGLPDTFQKGSFITPFEPTWNLQFHTWYISYVQGTVKVDSDGPWTFEVGTEGPWNVSVTFRIGSNRRLWKVQLMFQIGSHGPWTFWKVPETFQVDFDGPWNVPGTFQVGTNGPGMYWQILIGSMNVPGRYRWTLIGSIIVPNRCHQTQRVLGAFQIGTDGP